MGNVTAAEKVTPIERGLFSFVQSTILDAYPAPGKQTRIVTEGSIENRAVDKTYQELAKDMRDTGVADLPYKGNGAYSKLDPSFQTMVNMNIADEAKVYTKNELAGLPATIDGLRDRDAAEMKAQQNRDPTTDHIPILEFAQSRVYSVYDKNIIEIAKGDKARGLPIPAGTLDKTQQAEFEADEKGAKAIKKKLHEHGLPEYVHGQIVELDLKNLMQPPGLRNSSSATNVPRRGGQTEIV